MVSSTIATGWYFAPRTSLQVTLLPDEIIFFSITTNTFSSSERYFSSSRTLLALRDSQPIPCMFSNFLLFRTLFSKQDRYRPFAIRTRPQKSYGTVHSSSSLHNPYSSGDTPEVVLRFSPPPPSCTFSTTTWWSALGHTSGTGRSSSRRDDFSSIARSTQEL